MSSKQPLLKNQLKEQQQKSEQSRDKAHVLTMHNATKELLSKKIEDNALTVGDEIPLFALPNARGEEVEILELLKSGPLIINFYRGSWCPYCNLELRAYQTQLAKINSLGAQLIAISPELPDNSLSNAQKLELDFEVLSDVGNKVANQFGLVFKMSEDLVQVYKELDCDITKNNGDQSWELPIPATYVVDRNKKIIFSYLNSDYLQRLDPQEVIDVLETIKS